MVAIEWNHLDAAAWEAALDGAAGPTAYQQHWPHGAALQSLGVRIDRAAIYLGERLVGLVQVQHRRWLKAASLGLALRGPVWLAPLSDADKAAVYRALRKSLSGAAIHYGLWMPEADDRAALASNRMRRVVTPYHAALVDLTLDEDGMRGRMDGKWRNRLRAAERGPLRV